MSWCPSDHHHRVAVQDEILTRLAGGQVRRRRRLHLDRHAADVLLADPIATWHAQIESARDSLRLREQADTKIGRQTVGHDELRVDTAGRRGPD